MKDKTAQANRSLNNNNTNMESGKKDIYIAMSSELDYQYMYVAIHSIILTAAENSILHFAVLTGTEEIKEKIERAFINLFSDKPHSFNVYAVGEYFSGLVRDPSINGTKVTTFYRLLLPDLSESWGNIDRILYLDTDILVLADLQELYFRDIGDSLVAGCIAPEYGTGEEEWKNRFMSEYSLTGLDTYINAGVQLMNLVKMREFSFTKKAMELVPQMLQAAEGDQAILNRLCYGDISFLPQKYNVCNVRCGYYREQYGNLSDDDILEAYRNPVIIHYANWFMKPWKYPFVPYSELWWSVCRKGEMWSYYWKQMEDEFFYDLFYKRNLGPCKSWIKDPVRLCREADTVVVYGAGNIAKRIIPELLFAGVNVEAVIVSQEYRQPSSICGIPVCSIESRTFDKAGTLFVIATQESYTIEIIGSLNERGYYRILTLVDERL